MDKEIKQKVFVLPESLLNKNFEDNTIAVIKLKHPRTATTTLCYVDSDGKQLYEIVQFTDDFSSWFIDEQVEKDGNLYFMTVADPLFFILPYLNQDGKYCPLEDMLVDENYPDIKCLLQCCIPKKLEAITDSKDVVGETVYRFNKKKALSWLQYKVEKTSAVLRAKKLSIADGSKAETLVQKLSKESQNSDEIYNQHACQLVSEYLSDDISRELFSSLGLRPIEKEKRGTEEGANSQPHKKRKIEEIVSPSEDYSKAMNILQPKQKSKLTSTQKQLLKVDKSGMKSISSFFKKK